MVTILKKLTSLDRELYDFNETQLQQLDKTQDAMQEVLDQYAETFSCSSRRQLTLASYQLQPAFFEVLKLFGNYEASQTYFALNK